jgi:hypothetical protein
LFRLGSVSVGTPKPGHRNQDTETRTPKPGHRNQDTETRTPKPGHRNQDTETRTPKPGHRNQDTETRDIETGNPTLIVGVPTDNCFFCYVRFGEDTETGFLLLVGTVE